LSASIGSNRTVSLSGVNGEIIAGGHLDDDGHLREDSAGCWQVDDARSYSVLFDGVVRAIEVRIGSLINSVLEPGYFNYYDPEHGEADLMFGLVEVVYLVPLVPGPGGL
jgi:hypothetical protein